MNEFITLHPSETTDNCCIFFKIAWCNVHCSRPGVTRCEVRVPRCTCANACSDWRWWLMMSYEIQFSEPVVVSASVHLPIRSIQEQIHVNGGQKSHYLWVVHQTVFLFVQNHRQNVWWIGRFIVRFLVILTAHLHFGRWSGWWRWRTGLVHCCRSRCGRCTRWQCIYLNQGGRRFPFIGFVTRPDAVFPNLRAIHTDLVPILCVHDVRRWRRYLLSGRHFLDTFQFFHSFGTTAANGILSWNCWWMHQQKFGGPGRHRCIRFDAKILWL